MNASLRCIAAPVLGLGALAAAARAQTVVFADNFDGGFAQWSATALWHVQTQAGACMASGDAPPIPGGGQAAAFNNYIQGPPYCGFEGSTPGNLTTLAPISIPANATHARLRFLTYEETECGFGNCGWDHRLVYVSDDGGQTWDLIATGLTESVWYEREAPLDAYIGADIQIRFRFDPVDSLGNDYPGWFVDDVVVEVDSPFTPYCVGKVSSAHCVPAVHAAGSVSLTGPDDLVISSTLLRNNVASKLIWSRGANNTPFHGGTLCVAVPAARTTVTSSGGNAPPAADCSGTYSFAFTHAYLASKSVLAGETLHVQASTRDPGIVPPGNHSLSAAIAFTVLP